MRGVSAKSRSVVQEVRRSQRTFAALGNTRSVLWGAVAGVGAVVAGGLITVALAIIAWSLNHASGETATDAARLGVQGWFLSHGARIDVPWGVLSLAPLAITALVLYFLYRAGKQVARAGDVTTFVGAAEALVALVVGYVCAAVLLTSVATTVSAQVQPGSAALTTGITSAIGAGLGILVESGLGHRLINSLPGPGHAFVRAGIAAALTLIAASSLAVSISLVAHAGELSALTAAITPDTLGGWVILLLSVLYLPNAAVYGVAMTTGAGFSLGSSTSVSMTSVTHGELPAFPLLAALPDGAGGDLLTWLGALGPIAAGIAAAVVFVRCLDVDERDALSLAVGIAGTSIVAGLLAGGLTVLGTGAMGKGQLALVGAVGWQVGAATAACIAVIGGISITVVLAKGIVQSRPVRTPIASSVSSSTELVIDPEEEVAEGLQILAETKIETDNEIEIEHVDEDAESAERLPKAG